jgi:hypothetical protein
MMAKLWCPSSKQSTEISVDFSVEFPSEISVEFPSEISVGKRP